MDFLYSRRSAIRLGSAVVTGSLAGCSTLQPDEASTVTVSEIEIRNRLEREVEVSVLLLDDGKVAYWRTVSVGAPPNPFAALEDLPSESGEYVLYAHAPATDADSPVRADLTEVAGDRSCITFHMEVTPTESNGDQHPSVVSGTVGQCRSDE